MNKKNKLKAIVAIAVALVFVMPVAAVANDGTIGVTSDSENASGIENIVETSTDNDIRDNTEIIEIAIDDEIPFDEHEPIEDPFIEPTMEDPVIDTEEPPIVNDDTIVVLSTGNTIYVDDDNTGGPWNGTQEHPYQYVKDGVAAANAGDTVYIYNGTYNEYNIQVNKQLNIMGESRENVIINGGTSYSDVMKITADYVNISTLTMKRSASGGNNLNVYKVANFIIKDCNVDNTVKKGDGIEVYYPTGAIDIINCEVYNTKRAIYFSGHIIGLSRIIDCTIYDNTGWGITFRSSYYPVAPYLIKNCTSYNNYHGIYIDSMQAINGKGGDIIGCTTYDNTMYSYSCGIYIANSDYVNVVDCVTYNNSESGIGVGAGYNHPENCNITNCTSYNNGYGISLYAIACILKGNTMYGNGCNLNIESDSDPYEYIIDPFNTVNGKPVYWLIGAENLTLDGSLNFGYLGLLGCNNITARDAVPEGVILSYTTNATLSNLSVSGAQTGFYFYGGSNVKIDNCTAPGNSEYGFYIYYTDNVEITDCTITNMLEKDSDAFYVRGSPGVKITNCIAHDVGQSYGFNIYSCPNANLVNCQAYNGGPSWATGIALYDSPYVNLINCTVHHFQGGIYIRYDSPFTNVTDCTVHDITNDGFYIWASDCNYVNCTVYNTGSNGGFFLNQMLRNNFTNCKSYNNRCGAYFYGAQENNFVNCDFYNNSRHGLDIHKGPTNPSYGNTFTNCNIYNHTSLLDTYGNPIGYGVLIEENSYGTILTNCNVYNNNYGVYIYNSPNNVLRDVAIDNNNKNFNVIGSAIADFYQDIDTSNTINGDPIYYLIDEENITIGPTDAGIGYLALISCNNITGQNFDISGAGLMLIQTTNSTLFNVDVHDGAGILLWESSDNDITGCTVYNNTGHGIYLRDGSSDNDIASCTVYSNTGHGIYLLNSPNNNITTGCTVYDNNYGIYLSASPNTIITGCMIHNNTGGIYLSASPNTAITSCTVDDNNNYGIYLSTSPDTTITSCTIDNNNYGIHISVSANNILKNNILTNNIIGFGIDGTATTDFFQDIDESNTIDGDPIWYLVEDSDRIIDGSATFGSFGYLILVACDNMTVQNLDGADLLIILTTNSTFSNISAHDGVDGIYLWDSSYNDVIDCTAYNNTGNGIYIRGSYNNNVTNCMSYNNGGGIYLSGSPGNIIKLCDAYNNSQHGIYLTGSSYNDFTQCNAYNNGNDGFRLSGSSYNDLTQCDAYNNGNNGFYLTGSSYNDLIQCDAYSNNHGFYLIGGSTWNNIMSSDIYGNSNYGAYLKSSNNNNIVLCNSYSNKYGFYLDIVSYCNIEKCDIYDNSNTGIYGYKLKNSNIKECNIYNDSSYGIYLYYDSSYNVIEKCDLSHSTYGIYIYSRSSGYPARYNTIDDCKIHDNTYGIWFGSSYSKEDYNTIVNCDIYNNNNGIYYKGYYTKYNKAYHNTLAGNTLNAYTYKTPNYWDDGYPSGGNYWDDYSGIDNFSGPDQNIPGSDGIGDTPYVSGKVTDNYPLMSSTQLYYTLNISVVGSGTTIPAPSVYICLNGTVVNLEAFPDPGWEFTNWSGDIATTDNPTNITMDGNKTVTATFTQLYYDLNISVVGNGTTTPAEGVHSYLSYTVVDLEAVPDASWEFAGWSGDINTMDNQTNITMDGHKAVTATYIYRPVISDVTLTNSTPMDTEPGFGWERVTCTVTDNVEVGDVKLVVVYPNASIMEFDMIKDGDTYSYNTTFTDAGDYTYHIWANDTSDNENTSTPEIFTLYPNWDVDMNGVIRIQDFGAVAGHYGEDGPDGWIREDVDNNGAIRIQDFGAIAGHYGE